MMKFMNTSSQDDFDDFIYWIFSYFAWVTCLFYWQLRHFLIYISIFYLIFKNWQFCRKNCIVLITSKCFCNNSSWCFLIYSSILFFDICNFSWIIKNYSWSFRIILSVILISWRFANKISSLLILNILWLNTFFEFIWSIRWLKAFARSFFFFWNILNFKFVLFKKFKSSNLSSIQLLNNNKLKQIFMIRVNRKFKCSFDVNFSNFQKDYYRK